MIIKCHVVSSVCVIPGQQQKQSDGKFEHNSRSARYIGFTLLNSLRYWKTTSRGSAGKSWPSPSIPQVANNNQSIVSGGSKTVWLGLTYPYHLPRLLQSLGVQWMNDGSIRNFLFFAALWYICKPSSLIVMIY